VAAPPRSGERGAGRWLAVGVKKRARPARAVLDVEQHEHQHEQQRGELLAAVRSPSENQAR